MAKRINKILRELNIDLTTLECLLYMLGYKGSKLTYNTKVSDDVDLSLQSFDFKNTDFFKYIEVAAKAGVYDKQNKVTPKLKIVGSIDLNENNLKKKNQTEISTLPPLIYNEKKSFWISELAILSPLKDINYITIGSFDNTKELPLYSVLIGTNGVGKSSLMRDIIDFFIDLYDCVDDSKSLSSNKGWIKGIKYHIDGIECEIIKIGKKYFSKINNHIRSLSDLRLPDLVACNFGAFDKFPTQKISSSIQTTRYDVPYYKYVGAHVNGNIISSSAIAFRLLFTLSEQMNKRQRQNVLSTLDFIKYDHKVSLSYSLVMKVRRENRVLWEISRQVKKTKDFSNLKEEKKRNEKITQLYQFYNSKTSSGNPNHNYDLDLDKDNDSNNSLEELQCIYRLKQYGLVSSVNVIFYKQGCHITSEEMSSGEFAMLSTILSISTAVSNPHSLVLIDEPEQSLHPNWQMSIIDNLDRAITKQNCHFLIATHSHMLVSDLPINRSSVVQLEKDELGSLKGTPISDCTYGWSAEEVLLKVFKTATDRNRYFGERIGKLLEKMGNNSINPKEVAGELKELQEISRHLSDIDPMKMILNTIVETYNK